MSKSQSNLDNEKSGGVLWEAAYFLQMAEKLPALHKLHQEIDTELGLEDVLHVDQERVIYLKQYILLHFDISVVVELDYEIFADGLHRVENLGLLVFDQEDLTETSLTDLLLDVKVTKRGILVLFLLEYWSCLVFHRCAFRIKRRRRDVIQPARDFFLFLSDLLNLCFSLRVLRL